MKIFRQCCGLVMAIVAVHPNCWAVDVNFINGGDFYTAANWDDGNLPSDDGDGHFVQTGLTSTFNSAGVSVTQLIVSDSSPGTLLMTGGDLTIAGAGNDTFSIGRSAGGDGLVELSGTASLTTGSADSSFVGERDKGVLHIGPQASVMGTDVWRVGHRGPVICSGCEGDGLLDVEGTFSARLMFMGVDDGKGLLRVRGNGSVTLTDNLVPGVNTLFPNRSAKIEMIGSNAALSAVNLESANGAAENKNEYLFQADANGVSAITLADAVNIDNNKLVVDLTSFALAPGMSVTLFDAAPERVFGRFAEVMVMGVANAGDYDVLYLDQPGQSGDIVLANIVPEPSALCLWGLGMVIAIFARRSTTR